jgi:hypothetical protein
MRLRGLIVGCAVASAVGLLGVAPASADRMPGSKHGGKPLETVLLPGNEVPPHATAATGSAHITVNPGQSEVCWSISFADLSAPASAAHIHVGVPGVAGPVVIPTPVPSVVSGTGSGCTVVTDVLAHALSDNPAGYYVNVHNSVFPGGEIRGQLHEL